MLVMLYEKIQDPDRPFPARIITSGALAYSEVTCSATTLTFVVVPSRAFEEVSLRPVSSLQSWMRVLSEGPHLEEGLVAFRIRCTQHNNRGYYTLIPTKPSRNPRLRKQLPHTFSSSSQEPLQHLQCSEFPFPTNLVRDLPIMLFLLLK